jgi:hypothetical protein
MANAWQTLGQMLALAVRRSNLARGLVRAQGRRMPFARRLRAAWDCRECRLYRRAALLLLAMALLIWLMTAIQ